MSSRFDTKANTCVCHPYRGGAKSLHDFLQTCSMCHSCMRKCQPTCGAGRRRSSSRFYLPTMNPLATEPRQLLLYGYGALSVKSATCAGEGGAVWPPWWPSPWVAPAVGGARRQAPPSLHSVAPPSLYSVAPPSLPGFRICAGKRLRHNFFRSYRHPLLYRMARPYLHLTFD